MAKVANTFVSAVYVGDDRSYKLKGRIEQLAGILKERYANYEILIVDNGVRSSELAAVKQILPSVACIRIISLAKTYDTDTAIFAGIEASIGDVVCVLYGSDPVESVPEFVDVIKTHDIVFGVAKNLERGSIIDKLGAKAFYWYSKKYIGINIPKGSTYYIAMNRTVANAITKSGRHTRHIRHMAKLIGFNSTDLRYELPKGRTVYTDIKTATLITRAVDLVASYSSHPLRALTYFGILAGLLNALYAIYVVTVKLSGNDIAAGWTTLSLQSAFMFFLLFIILAILAEYIGKILIETQHEPPYHIKYELSSTVSIADETRRNVTK